MIKRVTYPQHIFKGITPNHKSYPQDANLKLFGIDTETRKGEPMTVQASDGVETLFEYVDGRDCFDVLMSWLFARCRSHGVNIAYAHFLRYDLPVIFFERRKDIYEQISEIKFKHHGYECNLLFGKVNKAEIVKGDRKLVILDSWSFTTNSLAKSLKQFKIPHDKHDKPDGIGKLRYDWLCVRPDLRAQFEAYARQDVVAQFHLGRRIMDYHKEFKVRPCISLPQFGTRVMRHHFFRRGEVIPFPPSRIVRGCELSYHGGENFYDDDKPKVMEDVFEADISSAYPHAMVEIPQMVKGFWCFTKSFDPDHVGVYRVSGHDNGKYPIVFDDNFTPVRGPFKDKWITGYELAEALKAPDVEVAIEEGLLWIHDPAYDHNPLAEYVRHFYKLKSEAGKDDPNRALWKLMLNAPTGKFVQATEIKKIVKALKCGKEGLLTPTRLGCDYVWDAVLGKYVHCTTENRAGGMYNPFLASQVTGHTRARIHREAVRYNAIHIATDAIKTVEPVHASHGLGGFELQTFGRCYFFRNKLYLHMGRDLKLCGHSLDDPAHLPVCYPKDWHDASLAGRPVLDEDGQHLCKYAMHGFKGSAFELFEHRHRIIRERRYEYTYDHMTGLREGMRTGLPPCAMQEDRREVLLLA